MENFWEFIRQIVYSISAFIDYFLYETPLFDDTLDAIYDLCVKTFQTMKPLVDEWIYYIGQYGGT